MRNARTTTDIEYAAGEFHTLVGLDYGSTKIRGVNVGDIDG